MPRSSYQEDASPRSAWIRRRRRRFGPAAALSVVLAIAWAAPANAAGPLYAVPDHPPSETESVGFTNALNDRVRHLPAPLDPPTAQSPEEVEARLEALERGVVIANGPAGGRRSAQTGDPGDKGSNRSVSGDDGTRVVVATKAPDDHAPLTIAFVAAGALALVGLLLVARGRHPGSPQRA